MSSIKLESNASGTGVFTIASPNSNTNRTLSIPDGTGSIVVNGVNSSLVSGTAVTCAGQTSIDFTGIPSWVKRITVMFRGVSLSGTSNILIQLGTSGGIVISGYVSTASNQAGTTTVSSTAGFIVTAGLAAAETASGNYMICLLGSDVWTGSGATKRTTSTLSYAAGEGSIGGTVTQLRVTTVNGTDTFDTTPSAGTINILYE